MQAAGAMAGMFSPTNNLQTQESMAAKQKSSSSGVVMEPNRLVLGGRRVVGEAGYNTIQKAWDEADDGDVIYVHSTYDAQRAGEQFPIVLDYEQKEVLLTGGHPSGSVIDAGDVNENVIEVLGRGMNDYRNNPLVQNLKIIGGETGLYVRAAPYATFKDLVVWMTDRHGIHIDEYTDPDSGRRKGTYGVTLRNCMAWNCGADGFRLDTEANPHGTTFYGCHSLLNGGVGLRARGYSTRYNGGTIQNNASFGVDARGGCGQVLDSVYLEGNGTASSYPTDVYVDDSAPGYQIDNCYFQGHFARDFSNGLNDAYRAIGVGGAHHTKVTHCTFRNYTDAFLYARGAVDLEYDRSSHTNLDGTRFFRDGGGNERIRSGGMVQECDLNDVDGRYRGDMAIHDGTGSGASWGPAIWTGYGWLSVVDGEYIVRYD